MRYTTLLLLALLSTALTQAAPAPAVSVYQSGEPGIFANAYLVETEHGVVVIDTTLSNTDSKALRAKIEAVHKPLLAVLLTHGHPDHYNGVVNLASGKAVPIVSTGAVAKVIKRDDAAKEAQWQPVFKDEWPSPRMFPNRTLGDGKTERFDGIAYTVHDLGPGESHADSIWVATGANFKVAFIGDVVLQGVHAYLSDGHSTAWLSNIERTRQLVKGASILYPGHGQSGGVELLDKQRDYLIAYRSAVAELSAGQRTLSEAQKNLLEARMLNFLGNERLRFLIKLGADPVAAELASNSDH